MHGTYFNCFYLSKSAVVKSTKVKLAGRDPPYTCVQNDSPVAAKVSKYVFLFVYHKYIVNMTC